MDIHTKKGSNQDESKVYDPDPVDPPQIQNYRWL